jgi:hypothetical protein
MDKQCGMCRFWRRHDEDTPMGDEFGSCHRHPPTIIASLLRVEVDGDGSMFSGVKSLIDATTYPVTQYQDYCGEWQE